MAHPHTGTRIKKTGVTEESDPRLRRVWQNHHHDIGPALRA
jgi:hypothetical protein